MKRSFSLVFLLTFVMLSLFSDKVFTQITYPIDLHDSQTIEACSGFFVDSGKDTLTTYGSEENYSVTFTGSDDDRPYFSMEFAFFDLGPGDYLYIYDGENDDAKLLFEAGEDDDLAGEIIFPTSDTLHFKFISSPSEHGKGWWAEINCYDICELFTADVTTEFETMKLCPGIGEVKLIAEGYYKDPDIEFDPDMIEYTWFYNNETHLGSTLYYDFFDPGAYSFHVNIFEPEHNCEIDLYETVQVGTKPTFDETRPSVDTACAEEFFTLFGEANMVTWIGFKTEIMDTVAIPDGTTQSYKSTLEFDVFDDNDIIESEDDFGSICLFIDHVDSRQLHFELKCPNGNSVMLKNYGGDYYANLGEPVVEDTVTPGVGYKYCFTPTPEYGLINEAEPEYHAYYDNAGNYYPNAPYIPPGNYEPEESFEEFEGSPLNGEWTLIVTDDIQDGNNGFMSGWRLLFNEDIYPDSLIFTPEIVNETWYDNSHDLQANPATVSKEDKGDYEFTFEITDNFNCTYDTTVSVNVIGIPKAEIKSYIELPFCEGDSTILSVYPINHTGHNWTYSWYYNDIELPGRIYDTLLVKETGLYRVDITDTETGCIASFDKDVSEENCDLVIPNVFTPNNSGINDYFEILNLENYESAQIVIYNRWGEKVFEHSDYFGNWWDGSGAPDGVYYYVLTYKRLGVTKRKNGVVHIVR